MTTSTNHPTPELLSESALAEIEARAEAATAPPWECGPTYRFIGAKNAPVVPYGGSAICNPNDAGGTRMYPTNRKNNALFIAHARTDIPALCATVRALWAEIKEFEQTDLVPRSRYNAADADWREARQQFQDLATRATVEIERLESANTALRDQLAQADETNRLAGLQIVELESRLAQVEKLSDFVSHTDECEWWGAIPRTTCSCGLADILEKL